jgi:hypothetical protein
MPAKKLKVEIFDAEGNRYTISCEGHVSREKILHVLDLAELLGGPSVNSDGLRRTSYDSTKFELFRSLIRQSFPIEWFSSKEAQLACEQELSLPFGLSTVSTYLARMADRGVLLRKGPSNDRKYKSLAGSYNNHANVSKDNK